MPRRDDEWIAKYILLENSQWGTKKNKKFPSRLTYWTVGEKIAQELGSSDNPDRLTVLELTANNYKGSFFSNELAVGKTFKDKTLEEQLTAPRDVGLVFAYMQLEEVVGKFCDTYNGIFYLLKKFDEWNPSVQPTTLGPIIGRFKGILHKTPDDEDKNTTPRKHQQFKETTKKTKQKPPPQLKMDLRQKRPVQQGGPDIDELTEPESGNTGSSKSKAMPKGVTKIAEEWSKHVQKALENFVLKAQENLQMMYDTHKLTKSTAADDPGSKPAD